MSSNSLFRLAGREGWHFAILILLRWNGVLCSLGTDAANSRRKLHWMIHKHCTVDVGFFGVDSVFVVIKFGVDFVVVVAEVVVTG